MKPRMSTKVGEIFSMLVSLFKFKKAGKRDQKGPITTQDRDASQKTNSSLKFERKERLNPKRWNNYEIKAGKI